MATSNEVVRPVANFSPSIWGDQFQHYVFDDKVAERYGQEIELLKGRVRSMLISIRSSKLVEKLNFIDTIERLGISYHFIEEIDEMLEVIYNAVPHFQLEDDLCTSALMFRLLRQHGYNISSRIFEKFQEHEKFKKILSEDIKGLLNLYEASHVSRHKDDNLKEAYTFSRTHLEIIGQQLNSILGRKVRHALEQPLHKGIPRVEICYFIRLYQEDESKNDVLLRFAMLDFNLLQMHHKQELYELIRWWKELDFVTTLTYTRDRIVECYFWALGVYFEPKYSKARLMAAKTEAMITTIDDTYDSFGKPDELEIYTDAVQKWDISQMNRLPSYMKIIYKALINLYDEEFSKELSEEGRYFASYYAKERMKEVVRAYNTESKWCTKGCMPPFAEYLKYALPNSTLYLLITIFFLGMKSVTRQEFEWLDQNPRIVEATLILGRAINDLGSYEREKSSSNLSTIAGINCYMNDYSVSTEEAMDKFQEMIENAWKDINEEILQPTFSREILTCLLNISRVNSVMYMQRHDGFTDPEKVMKPYMTALLVDSFGI